MWVLDYLRLKYTVVLPQDIVAAQMQQLTLSDLPESMPVAETQPPPKVAKEVHQPKGGQEVGHLLVTGILQMQDFRFQVPH